MPPGLTIRLWWELLGMCWRRNKVLFLGTLVALLVDTFAVAVIGIALRAIVSGTVADRTGAIVVGALGAAAAYTITLIFRKSRSAYEGGSCNSWLSRRSLR